MKTIAQVNDGSYHNTARVFDGESDWAWGATHAMGNALGLTSNPRNKRLLLDGACVATPGESSRFDVVFSRGGVFYRPNY